MVMGKFLESLAFDYVGVIIDIPVEAMGVVLWWLHWWVKGGRE